MKRRSFLVFCTALFAVKLFAKGKNEQNNMEIIKSAMKHMFPTTKRYKGAREFKAFRFLLFVSTHPTFEKKDFKLLMEGAEELQQRYPGFAAFDPSQKEKSLREFETTLFGQNWLSLVLYYGLEAMLGDPVYGGNDKLCGWKNFDHTSPKPTAAKPFGKLL